jgi:hypothetical protein
MSSEVVVTLYSCVDGSLQNEQEASRISTGGLSWLAICCSSGQNDVTEGRYVFFGAVEVEPFATGLCRPPFIFFRLPSKVGCGHAGPSFSSASPGPQSIVDISKSYPHCYAVDASQVAMAIRLG